MAHIWYRKNEYFGTIAEKPNIAEYDYVGSITADRLGAVFRAMNHVDDSEIEEELKALRVRSMSVGDVVVNAEGTWLCDFTGWTNLNGLPEAKDFTPPQ